METDVKSYEIAYLINPDVPEEGVFGEAGKITGFVQDAHGLVGKIEEPKKRKLTYPVKKFKNAYFGWTTFSVAPERVGDIEKRMKAEPAIIRYMLSEEIKHPVYEFRPRPTRPRQNDSVGLAAGGPPIEHFEPETQLGEVKPFEPAAPKEEDQTKNEELDKRLEEILGK